MVSSKSPKTKTNSGTYSKSYGGTKNPLLKGQDIDGNRVCPFDFVATIDNRIEAHPTMEQADAHCKEYTFGGYIINSPISKAWKNLEYSLLNTIKKYNETIVLKDEARHQTIKIFPKGGRNLDTEANSPLKYYPTFQITYHLRKTNGESYEDTVDYEYFQISAEQRAWIALNLLEKFA